VHPAVSPRAANVGGACEDVGMKFSVERDALAEAVTWVARALPARPVVPLLSGLLVRAGQQESQEESGEPNGPSWLTLACFDYEVSARIRVRAEVSEPGTFLVPGRLLMEIIRSLPSYPVEFADDPDGVSVTCGEVSFALATLPLGEYPELPDLPHVAGTVDAGEFATAIGQVTPAASRDDTLPMLTAVNVEFDAAAMTLAATDRYRLAVRELTWAPAEGAASENSASEHSAREHRASENGAGPGRTALLVPAKTLGDAARMMTHGGEVRILLRTGADGGGPASADIAGPGATDAMIGFESGERRLTTRLLAGEFVKYRSRFPEEFGCTADLPAEAFADAVRRVALVAERGTPVQLSFTPGQVTIGAGTQGQARARETVPAEFTGDEPSIAFSPHYLLDGVLAAMAAPGTDEKVTDPEAAPPAQVRLRFTSASKPAVITPSSATGQPFRYLVVPQRVSR
jgi:DNA polymerase III subunit beta